MKNITSVFADQFIPFKGLIFYQHQKKNDNTYVEAYDLSNKGRMINAHPLSHDECKQLAETLKVSESLSDHFLQPESLLPSNVLYLRSGADGFVIWHTPPMVKHLLFTAGLGIKDGNYPVPPMLWKADRNHLSVYAMFTSKKPGIKTSLFHAPFFNVNDMGRVCMGTVDINIEKHTRLERFICLWQDYFFNSKFSHVNGNASPMEGNIIQQWKSLLENKKFPVEYLKPHTYNIQNLIL